MIAELRQMEMLFVRE